MSKEFKVSKMRKIEELERIIIELEEWKPGGKLSPEIEYIVGKVIDLEQRNKKIKFYKENISAIRENEVDDGKLYLSEIIAKENITFPTNNSLILAPVGSGKSTFIYEILEKEQKKALMLVSNTALKNSISPDDNDIKMEMADRTYTTQNENVYGKGDYVVHVMSYSEFGKRVRLNDDFIEDIHLIFCDEIHSLPNYQGFQDSANLSHAMKTLFANYEDKKIYYFTATDEYLKDYERKHKGALRNIEVYDFRLHPEIKQYVPLSEYKFSHIEQIRSHLKARIKTFNHFGYKCLAFSRTIQGQKRIAEIAEEEGYAPLVLWSVNNVDDDLQMTMTEEQMKARDYLLRHNEIPSPYNFLIINSAMQEGWNLKDHKVKLAIMNTTSETEKVQALGRLRGDIDILAYKVSREEEAYVDVLIPKDFIGKELTKDDKTLLCQKLNIINAQGEVSRWTTIKSMITEDSSIYLVRDKTVTLEGKRTRVSVITIKEDIS